MDLSIIRRHLAQKRISLAIYLEFKSPESGNAADRDLVQTPRLIGIRILVQLKHYKVKRAQMNIDLIAIPIQAHTMKGNRIQEEKYIVQ